MSDEPGSKIPPFEPLRIKRQKWEIEDAKGKKAVDAYRSGFGAVTRMQQKIAEITEHGDKVIEFVNRAMNGDEPVQGLRERLHAADMLMVRLWGKPVDVQITAQVTRQEAERTIDATPADLMMTIRRLKEETEAEIIDVTPEDD